LLLQVPSSTGSTSTKPPSSDNNHQLATYMNTTSNEDIPRWEARTYTRIFRNMAARRGYKVYKISRTLNTSAHVLTSQAGNSLHTAPGVFVNCHCVVHISSCSIQNALDLGRWVSLTHLTALCCLGLLGTVWVCPQWTEKPEASIRGDPSSVNPKGPYQRRKTCCSPHCRTPR
jgi:hypothetical protein